MNKQDIVKKSAEAAGISQKAAEEVFNTIIESIQTAVKKEKSMTIVGFGTWKNVRRKARTGVNPATGAKIKIAAKNVVKFKASASWKV